MGGPYCIRRVVFPPQPDRIFSPFGGGGQSPPAKLSSLPPPGGEAQGEGQDCLSPQIRTFRVVKVVDRAAGLPIALTAGCSGSLSLGLPWEELRGAVMPCWRWLPLFFLAQQ